VFLRSLAKAKGFQLQRGVEMKNAIFLGVFTPIGGTNQDTFVSWFDQIRDFLRVYEGLITRVVVFPRGEDAQREVRGEFSGGPAHEVTASMLLAREMGRTFPIHVESLLIRNDSNNVALREARLYAEAQGAGGIIAWFPGESPELDTVEVLKHIHNHHRAGPVSVTMLDTEMV
jgi:hypothetical protein